MTPVIEAISLEEMDEEEVVLTANSRVSDVAAGGNYCSDIC